ncbi:uncharacterized protein LOC129895979 [Solanum dulcamara]|uniref:uncharacterized protein LOC129895979 n=1 Tax=Solanum dulcamara TaxID=45834 RepID=UPI0024857303|nr:uncharacterized protein LOC129895979 [Solanum dulcamara]
MAVRHSLFASSTHLIWKSCSTKRENPAQRVVLVYSCASDQNISIKATALQIRSTSTQKLKVFEDESTGIVCYRDENGEITCEGYDEGPRYCQKFHRFSSNSRDEEIKELLQRCWFHVTD